MYIEFPIVLKEKTCHSVDDLKKLACIDSDAISLLGDCYFDGCGGVTKNTYIGLIYYILAAACNNTRAYVILGYYHENGQGVTKDKDTAMLLFLAAHAFGEEQGVQALSQLFFNETNTIIEGYANDEIAKSLLRYAYEVGNDEAIYYCQEYYPEVLSSRFDNYKNVIERTGVLEIAPSDIYKLKKYVLSTALEIFPSLQRANVISPEESLFIKNTVNELVSNHMIWRAVEEKATNKISPQDSSGTVFGNISNASTIYGELKFNASRGHGFAAERANHLLDVLSGKNAYIIGDDNAKNGADRLVDGIYIQSKYCNSASKSIQECFENGRYRYMNPDGTPMQVEVPSDQYEGAVQAMENRIRRGEVPGVNDPAEAENIVRKGHFTYEQAKNIAKFGTVESLTYDAVNGAIIGSATFGVTAVMNLAVAIWQGKSIDEALEIAIKSGIKVGGVAFATAIIAGQMTKAGVTASVSTISEKAIQYIGPKASAHLVNAFRSGTNIYGAAAMKSAQKMVGNNIVTGLASVAVLSTFDVVNIFEGRISVGQFAKNLLNTSAAVAGGSVGWTAGATAGAALGSVVPVLGTAIGGVIGGLCGSFFGSSTASKAVNYLADGLIVDDAEEMIAIIEDEFKDLAFVYLLNAKEADRVVSALQNKITPDSLKDMYASYSRRSFANRLLVPIVENIVKRRAKVILPNSDKMTQALRTVLENQ